MEKNKGSQLYDTQLGAKAVRCQLHAAGILEEGLHMLKAVLGDTLSVSITMLVYIVFLKQP